MTAKAVTGQKTCKGFFKGPHLYVAPAVKNTAGKNTVYYVAV